MASISAAGAAYAERRERLFFLLKALAIAGTAALAFGKTFALGLSSLDAPWWVHLHALTFVGWLAFYVGQNWLIFSGRLALHRKAGVFGAVLAGWMVLVGLILTPLTLAVGRVLPIFTPAYFLALDWSNIIIFGGLFVMAIKNVRRTDWHRRLMLCATIILMPPAFGRLNLHTLPALPLPQIGPATTQALQLAVYVLAAMVFDFFNRGRVHPAWLWGLGALAVFGGVTALLAEFPPFIALANAIEG